MVWRGASRLRLGCGAVRPACALDVARASRLRRLWKVFRSDRSDKKDESDKKQASAERQFQWTLGVNGCFMTVIRR
jgi:hypothetical protein